MATISELEKKADKLYSEHLRKSNTDYKGMVKCILCGAEMGWQDAECSHYISRQKKSIRFNPLNTHISCHACNEAHNYSQERYRTWMLSNTPPGTISKLHKLSYQVLSSIDYRQMLENIIRDMKVKLRKL